MKTFTLIGYWTNSFLLSTPLTGRQDQGEKVATKCIRVSSTASTQDVIETLREKFRSDMRMLSQPVYALYVTHADGEWRRLDPGEGHLYSRDIHPVTPLVFNITRMLTGNNDQGIPGSYNYYLART